MCDPNGTLPNFQLCAGGNPMRLRNSIWDGSWKSYVGGQIDQSIKLFVFAVASQLWWEWLRLWERKRDWRDRWYNDSVADVNLCSSRRSGFVCRLEHNRNNACSIVNMSDADGRLFG